MRARSLLLVRSSEYRPRADLTDRHRSDVADVDRVQEEPAGLRLDGAWVEEREPDVVALGFRPADHAGGDLNLLELKGLRRRMLEDFSGLEEVGSGVVHCPVFRLDAEILELVVNAVEEILETVALLVEGSRPSRVDLGGLVLLLGWLLPQDFGEQLGRRPVVHP